MPLLYNIKFKVGHISGTGFVCIINKTQSKSLGFPGGGANYERLKDAIKLLEICMLLYWNLY